MRSSRLALTAAAAMALSFGPMARTQHATEFDIESAERSFADNCASCHGPDGNLIEGIDLGRGLFRRALSDAELVDIIVNGIADTPMPATPGMSEEQASRIVAWLRSNAEKARGGSLAGSAANGRRLFEGRGGCLDCHAVDGHGSRVGPDLSRIGLTRQAEALRTSLIDPAAQVQPENRSYSVTLGNGDTVTGRLLNHDTFTVQLLDENERLRSFDKTGLLEYGFIATPMPSYADRFSAQEIADVVSYMTTLQAP